MFDIRVGINNLNITGNKTYSMGSMLKISPVNNQAELNMIQVTDYKNADYIFEQSLTKIRPNEISSYYRLSVKALTTRFINNLTSGSITQSFNSSGNYSLIFNMSTSTTMVNSRIYTAVVKPGKKIKVATNFLLILKFYLRCKNCLVTCLKNVVFYIWISHQSLYHD